MPIDPNKLNECFINCFYQACELPDGALPDGAVTVEGVNAKYGLPGGMPYFTIETPQDSGASAFVGACVSENFNG